MSHNENPIALVDRDGVVWPWDGQPVNEYLVGAGSRYIYDEDDYKACMEQYTLRLKSQARRRVTSGDPGQKPAKKKRVGSAKQVAEAVLGAGKDEPQYTPAP